MASSDEEAKLERFLQWLQVNRVELRGTKIKYCDTNKGFGIFSADETSDGILLVVPLDLAITPMRVLQDALLGPECRTWFEEGEVDDRLLMILFLTLERLRKKSSWKPYLDMLPRTFGNPLWFTDEEFLELKGTTLYRATELQKKSLQSLYDNKVEGLVKKLLTLDGDSERANSVFWTRALNIPLPHSYVFPQTQVGDSNFSISKDSEHSTEHIASGELVSGKDEKGSRAQDVNGVTSASTPGETIWVEGLVPGIDFCNHDLKAAAVWEVDGMGSITGVPFSMYLLSAEPSPFGIEREISISYGNKGNEELLYLYGFVIDNNPDDYLMVHYPREAIQSVPFSELKSQLLEAQKAELRCLLPRSLLDQGYSLESTARSVVCNYSWSGQRNMPSYLNKLVFPENFLTALRTIALKEEELFQVSSMLEELVGSEEERQPSDTEVRSAVWEACGDSGALQLLVDLLQTKMMDLEDNSGTEDCDNELLKEIHPSQSLDREIVYNKNLSLVLRVQFSLKAYLG
ncbi:Ribulose-1,5 bisphosphate carboxylase/oxygenase large subunit N-methyltransferase, chloroplastic [Morella rubra]|uniref:Ribulose-1,5 bisphosphate carboxylase/oxygenase large subunit N-methyltransferase, chloroplastic n=1 Tax=Morella rubra TaxID=262757 RepID=A0A6A1VUY7_9ROSI|nr:Ribulose-1,5 bisphosphate carboxylase/oxygenase large subunit N-methyltransferase, chloroplastic [Morella rubra]